MYLKIVAIFLLILSLSACQSFSVPPYSVSPDTVRAIKDSKIKDSVGIGTVSTPANMDISCRAMGPLKFPNRGSLSEYVKKAMEDELKLADAFAYQNPKIILTPEITRFEMSSMKSLVRGYFDIDLKINSSNGKFLKANEYYEFASGLDGYTACKNTSDALMTAIQELIAKVYTNPNFVDLIKISTTRATKGGVTQPNFPSKSNPGGGSSSPDKRRSAENEPRI